ncbi:MAG: hypothetical protein WBL35_00235 [Ornithinibacter sp.]
MSPCPGRRRPLLALVAASLLVLGGCSGEDADSGATAAGEPTSASLPATPDSEDAGTQESGASSAAADGATDSECQALQEGYSGYVSTVNMFTVLDKPEAVDLGIGEAGFTTMEAYAALLRPHQDAQGEVFGTLREGLDNLEADIALARDQRLDERTGEYNVVAVATVLEAVGC